MELDTPWTAPATAITCLSTVRICNDGTGHCTLRAAIQASNAHAGDDGIFFDIPTAGNNCDASGNCTINLGTALPDLSDGVTITGPGADKLTVQRNSSTQFRIFNVTTTGTVSFSGLTIANGFTSGEGGGIQNVNSGTANVTNCTLSGNNAGGGGGGITTMSTMARSTSPTAPSPATRQLAAASTAAAAFTTMAR